MPAIRNVNPIGDVEVPLLRRVVERGETVNVTDDHARRLLLQADNWQPADDAARAISDELHAPAPAEVESEPAAEAVDTEGEPA